MKKILILIFAMSFLLKINGQSPQIGAQVWLEPVNTSEEIEGWFKTLGDNHMTLARIFIIWNYIEPRPGEWDFSLYDKAFEAARRHGVKIFVTLVSNLRPPHRGDFYQIHAHEIDSTWAKLNESKIYIDKVVQHYANHPALHSWLVNNEVSQDSYFHPLALDRYKVWLKNKYGTIDKLNTAWITWFPTFEAITPDPSWNTGKGYWYNKQSFLDFKQFWCEHIIWWQTFIANEIRLFDKTHPIQGHTAGLYRSGGSARDLPGWRSFADILGTSIHPSHHFTGLGRNQYPLGVSYSCEVIRGAAEPKPFWATEVQGGQNIYSGSYPLTPTYNDIAQWTWTSIGAGAQSVVYWILNNRFESNESNEWSMLDFKGQPTERITAAADIAKTIDANNSLFKQSKKFNTGITIMLSLESMQSELYKADESRPQRSSTAQYSAIMGYYKTFNELGIPVNIKFINDFKWDSTGLTNQLVILPNVTVISRYLINKMKSFVSRGNHMLITGMSGMWDENTNSYVLKQNPLEDLLGGEFRDYRLIKDNFDIYFDDIKLNLPTTYWAGVINPKTSKVMAKYDGRPIASLNKIGNGDVYWVPSLIDLTAWTTNSAPLALFLQKQYPDFVNKQPIRFAKSTPNCVNQVLKSGKSYISVITNGNAEPCKIDLISDNNLKPRFIWGKPEWLNQKTLTLGGRETAVIVWDE